MASLLRFYGNVFDLITARQYQDAQRLLSVLEYAQIPDELRDTINSCNRLSTQLVTMLNNLEAILYEASTLFASDQVESAKQRLAEADATIESVQFLLEDIEAAAHTLGSEAAIYTVTAGRRIGLPDERLEEDLNRLKLAYEHEEESLNRLGQLVDELDYLRESITKNPQMVIDASFYYPTLLEVSVAESAYPGLPITLSGRISSRGGAVERTVKVILDNTELAEEIIQGHFSLQIVTPQQISVGEHSLTLVVVPQGRYAGVSKSLPINISRIPIRTEVQAPLLTVIPKAIRVSGQVYHGLTPVKDAKVRLVFRDSRTVVKTSSDGSFTANMGVPFDLSLIGPQELRLDMEPVEPWYTPLEIKREILIINPVNIGLMLVAFISAGLLVRRRVRTSFPSPPGETVIPEAGLWESHIVAQAPRPEHEFTGIKGRIFSAYLNGLEAVRRVVSIPMAPHTTLREFLNAATSQLPTAIEPFTELTTIAEAALYSAHELDEDTAARAEALAAIVKEELPGGAA